MDVDDAGAGIVAHAQRAHRVDGRQRDGVGADEGEVQRVELGDAGDAARGDGGDGDLAGPGGEEQARAGGEAAGELEAVGSVMT